MIDPLVAAFLMIIVVCVPLVGYLLPQDPTVARSLRGLSRWRRHRQLRRWVHQLRGDQQRRGR